MAELVDAHDSGSCARKGVWVRVPFPAPESPAKAGLFLHGDSEFWIPSPSDVNHYLTM